jgi:CDP-diacylglycerol--glycerol-3-phosphate 3-phosphatidyltransferase
MIQTATTEAAPPKKARILGLLPDKWHSWILGVLGKLANFFVGLNISPNVVTVFGLVAGLGAGFLFAVNHPIWAAVLITVSGIFDILDGKVAAKANKKSLYGAIFDSTLDRYAEFFIYFGLAVYFRNRWLLWIVFFTFLGSTMVSYTRARAEGLGIECKVGFMQRAERMILLIVGALVGSIFKIFDLAMIVVLGAIALVSNVTAFERTFHVRKIEIQKKSKKEV